MTPMPAQSSPADSTRTRGAPVVLPAGGAVLVAFAAFAVFYREAGLTFLLGALFAAPYLVPLRLPAALAAQIGLRAALYAGIAVYSVRISNDFRFTTVYAGWVQVATRCCMIELILQNWRNCGAEEQAQARTAAMALLSGIVFAAASKTIDVGQQFIYFALPYFFCLVFALRGARVRRGDANLPWYVPKVWMHVAALLAVLGLGLGFVQYVSTHKRQLAPFFGGGGIIRDTRQEQIETVGFSDFPILRRSQNAVRSLERVLTLSGPLRDPHLRGLVFDRYIGGRWLVARPPSEPSNPAAVPAANDIAGGGTVQVERLSDYISVLFVSLNSAAVSCDDQKLLEFDADHGCTLRAFAPAPFRYNFAVDGAASSPDSPGRQGPLCAPPNASQRRRLLIVPGDLDNRVVSLSKQLVLNCRTPREKIRAIEDYLRAHNAYSLQGELGNGDPVSEFVLSHAAAHCEYFASAATLMLRCVGVPTCYVTGYYAHERTSFNHHVVRQQDAHAWAESWIDDGGWVTVDATPSGGTPGQLGQLAPVWRNAWEYLEDIYFGVLHWLRARTRYEWAAIVLGAAAAALALGLVWRRIRTRRLGAAHEHFYTPPGSPVAELAARFEKFLARRLVPCPSSTTWGEHLAALARTDPALRAGVDLSRCDAFVLGYTMLRFGEGGEGGNEARMRGLKADLDALERR